MKTLRVRKQLRFSNILKALLFFAAILMMVGFLYPVIAPGMYANQAAYQRVLGFHRFQQQTPRWHNQVPFLYLTWFPKGNPTHAVETLAYEDGMLQGRRVLWDFATEGGGSQAQNMAAFESLRRLPALPSGASGPGAVPYVREMIVSQCIDGQWRTYYYDRDHLPAQVEIAQRLIVAAGGPMLSE